MMKGIIHKFERIIVLDPTFDDDDRLVGFNCRTRHHPGSTASGTSTASLGR